MRLIIAGGRDYQLTEQDIQKLNEIPNVMTVLSGCASGADECGERWAAEKGIPVVQFPALWAMYGKKAGPLRNKDMAKDADALAIFPGGRGTDNMVRQALYEGLTIFDFRELDY